MPFTLFTSPFTAIGQIPDELLIRANAKKENDHTHAAGTGTGEGGSICATSKTDECSDDGGGSGATSLQGVVREVARQLVSERRGDGKRRRRG